MTKEARIYNGDKITSSINGVGKTVWPHAKESNWTLTSCTEKNSKWMKALNVRSETIKQEENIESKLFDIDLLIFFWMSLQAGKTKAKNKQMGLYQTKKLLQNEENYQQNKTATY